MSSCSGFEIPKNLKPTTPVPSAAARVDTIAASGIAWLRGLIPSLLVLLASMLLCGLLVLGATRSYYAYRLNIVERSSAAGAVGTTTSGGQEFPDAVRTGPGITINSVRTGDEQYYSVLRPHVPRVEETVLNPQLAMLDSPGFPTSAAGGSGTSAHAAAEERRLAALVEEARRTTPAIRRYVLAGTKLGQRYMLRMSFLGSPSVGYRTTLYHVRRASLRVRGEEEAATGTATTQRRGQAGDSDAAPRAPGESTLQFEPLDTEVVTLTMHERFASQYTDGVELVYDAADLLRRAQAEESQSTRRAATAREGLEGVSEPGEDAANNFVAVVEVTPYVLSLAGDPRRFAVLSYNIDLTPFVWNAVPDIALPLIMSFSLIAMGLGRGLLYPWLLKAVVNSAERDELPDWGEEREEGSEAGDAKRLRGVAKKQA